MSIMTSAAISGGYYGTIKTGKKGPFFCELGKAVTLETIVENIETQDVKLKLSFLDREGNKKFVTVPHKELGDGSIVTTLAAKGADVTKKTADVLIDTLRLQEEDFEQNNQKIMLTYDHLGWVRVPNRNANGSIAGSILCYRAFSMVGGIAAKYVGNYKVTPMGSYEVWRSMVQNEVLGHDALCFALIAGLSAIIVGILSLDNIYSNPIVHYCYASGMGKSTGGYLAASAFGEPFDGQKQSADKQGTLKKQRSLYQSWGSTANATTTALAGNRGAAVILNELGKFRGSDMTSIVYDLSEGSDKARLDGNMELRLSDIYTTTFLSFGEKSLLAKCKEKTAGQNIRVMEIEQPLTVSAEHSRRVKEVCTANNGHAAPKMAEYIINHGGIGYVRAMYETYISSLNAKFPKAPSKERFIEKYAAIFLTTAEIGKAALNIDFDLNTLTTFLMQYEKEHGQERDVASASYDTVIEECRANITKFYRDRHLDPVREAWGRVKYPENRQINGRNVLEEYAIRKKALREILDKNHLPNPKTCLDAWKAMNVLDYETGRNTRSRKIDIDAKSPEDVYVLLVLDEASPDWVKECESGQIEAIEQVPVTVPVDDSNIVKGVIA